MTLANQLTIARLIMAPLFAVFLMREAVPSIWIASSLFTAACITDRIDGIIARRTNTVTELGRMLDPLADKLLIGAAFVALYMLGIPGVELWMVIVIVGREILVTWLRSHVGKRGMVIHSSGFAKWKTTFQMVIAFAFLGMMSYRAYTNPDPSYWTRFGEGTTEILKWGMLVTTIVTFLSGADYLWKSRQALSAPVKPS